MYDTVSQIKSPFTTHVAPNTSTNLTMSFSNQLNTVHNQVLSEGLWELQPRWAEAVRETSPVLGFLLLLKHFCVRAWARRPAHQVQVLAMRAW